MSEGSSAPSISDVHALLQASRQDPTVSNFNAALQQAATWLLAQEDKRHWFCSKDQSTTEDSFRDLLEVSTFCLRLSEFKVGFMLTVQLGTARALAYPGV